VLAVISATVHPPAAIREVALNAALCIQSVVAKARRIPLIRAIVSLCLAVAACLALGVGPAVAGGHPPMMLGPGDAHVHDIKDKALIRMSKFGYVYIAGQQHSHLRVTFVEGANSLRYRDTGTKRLGTIPKSCHRQKVNRGIAALCRIPPRFHNTRMFVQVWPRLGNDYVDGRTLPRKFRLWVLADAGRDVVHGGAGNDFVNGAKGADRIYGGAGNDFLRSGLGNDRVWGGKGKDRVS
jgi:RTX calcium-binding nonapeptide repeat (4 copies)